MAGAQSQVGRNGAPMQGAVVNGTETRLEPDRPTLATGPLAEIHILVIEEEFLVEAFELAPAIAVH